MIHVQSVFSVTLTMHFECHFRVWCLWQYSVCVIYWHLCPILTSTQTWWLCLYREWTINPWMVRSDKGRWAVVSPMNNRKTFYYLCFAHRRFSNVPLANVLSRFSLTKRSESYTYIYLVFSAITQKRPIHVCYCTHCRWSGERSWRTDLAWYDGETICRRSDRESKGEAFHEIKTSCSYPFMWFFFSKRTECFCKSLSSQVSKLCYNAFVTLFKQDSVGSVSLEVNCSSLIAYILRKNISLASPSEIIFISSWSSVFKITTDILSH